MVGLPFVGWEQFPVMGCNRKSFSQNLAENFIPYFTLHSPPGRAVPASMDLVSRAAPCLDQGKSVPNTRSLGLAGLGDSPTPRGQPQHRVPSPAVQDQRAAREAAWGLGRISRRWKMEEQRTGWQGLGLVRQHMPASSCPALQLQPGTSRSSLSFKRHPSPCRYRAAPIALSRLR